MRTVEHCIVCGHGPLVLSHLYDHLRRSHSWNEAQIGGEKLRIRAKKGSLRCDICDKIYSTLHSLRHHKLKLHPSGKTSSNVICPECGQRFYTYRDLAKHCNDWHTTKPATQDYSIITGQFDCYTAFEEWKESLESSSRTNFSKRYSVHCKDGGRRHVFVCKHARGKVMASAGTEKPGIEGIAELPTTPLPRTEKPGTEEKPTTLSEALRGMEKPEIKETKETPSTLSQASPGIGVPKAKPTTSSEESSPTEKPGNEGTEDTPTTPSHSKRILSHCPAFLRVCENADGSVTYEGCIGHLGHAVSAASLRIPKSDQEEILGMLRRGLHAYEIVAKIRRERWDHSLSSDQQARICYVEAKDVWRMAHRFGLVQRRYRTAKRLAATEQKSEQDSRNEEVSHGEDFDCHVQEMADSTENGDQASETTPLFFQPLQRVDTAAIEAFQSFQEINRFVNELMELCVKSNQYELISQMNSAMMTKANEIAGAIGVNTELFLQRIPTLAQLSTRDPPRNPVEKASEKYVTVPQYGHEESETKPPPNCGSQPPLKNAKREECEVVDINSILYVKKELSSTIDEVILMD